MLIRISIRVRLSVGPSAGLSFGPKFFSNDEFRGGKTTTTTNKTTSDDEVVAPVSAVLLSIDEKDFPMSLLGQFVL